jgi:hypothetical protein
MLISTALLFDSNVDNSVCTPAKLKNFIIALKNDTLGHFFKANECKNEPLWNFFFNASGPI